jgi:prepilin-type processing-associated H-X9-DG protein
MTTDSGDACFIRQIGTAVPEPWLDSDGSADLLRHACISPRGAKLLQRVSRLTGIRKRHVVALNYQSRDPADNAMYQPSEVQPHGPGMSARTAAFDRESGPLVLRALGTFAPQALERVQTLVTVSCTHASSPGLERPILAQTPVPATVDRWNLGFMGCSAGLAGIRLVKQTEALRRECLIVTCELSSLHFQYSDQLDQMTANVLFADGAAALLVSPQPGPAKIVACRCVAAPQHADQMIWYAGDHGLQLRLSQELPDTLAAHLPESVDVFLRDNGMTRATVQHWLVHPGGPQILDAVQNCLSLQDDALNHSRAIFCEFGNMSSPTILFILKRVLESNAQGPALLLAFGPGLTIEMVLLDLRPAGRD